MVKQLADGSVAVALVNQGSTPASITTSAAEVGLDEAEHYTVRNVWTRATAVTDGSIVDAAVPTHGVTLLRVGRG
ncbi:hypothetical protein OG563_36985 [Nocardia vinacea]|uniref:Alpha galactosidase C-terminal domain-containing protein n=1 Tax=Nocardia vinacea TaxID=96468 RepID=A0ABZ1YN81_9NOCA|nr:hypothetical protein [Nocardia vinacea]